MSKPTVMIDARVVETHVSHGISRYTYELIHNFSLIFSESNINVVILVNAHSCLLQKIFPKEFSFEIMKTRWTNIKGQWEILCKINKFKPVFFHSPSFIIPLFSKIPLLATIHDMNHVSLAKNYSLKQKIYYKLLAKRLMSKSRVITVSEFSKGEILKHIPMHGSKIDVIYNGVSDIFKPKYLWDPEELETTKIKYNLPENYFFTLGNHKPHKNLNTVIDAYMAGNFSESLVILTDKKDILLKKIEELRLEKKIHVLQSISESKYLAQIYAMSACFIYPSFYEGFGLPILEAAACGTLVISSDQTSMPEILQDSAIYFNPYSSKDLSDKMAKAKNLSAEEKNKIIQNALEKSSTKTWFECAKKTLNIYLDLISHLAIRRK